MDRIRNGFGQGAPVVNGPVVSEPAVPPPAWAGAASVNAQLVVANQRIAELEAQQALLALNTSAGAGMWAWPPRVQTPEPPQATLSIGYSEPVFK